MSRPDASALTPGPDAVLARHGRSFHFASRLLGPRHGSRAARLYAFCRHLDDIADETRDAAQARSALERVRIDLEQDRSADPATQDFLALRRETGMAAAPALDLIDGLQGDLCDVAVHDEAELIGYAYRVAGTVGLMMCAVLDARDPAARPFAVDLGIAMQLTNIARDVGEDARLGRRYLPAGWVGGASPEQIADPDRQLQATLRDATARLLGLAERYYRSGEAGLGFLPARPRAAILVAARVYRAIGREIAAGDYRSWDRRAVVSGPKKLRHGSRALADYCLSARLHGRDSRHDAALHAPLRGLAASAR